MMPETLDQLIELTSHALDKYQFINNWKFK